MFCLQVSRTLHGYEQPTDPGMNPPRENLVQTAMWLLSPSKGKFLALIYDRIDFKIYITTS